MLRRLLLILTLGSMLGLAASLAAWGLSYLKVSYWSGDAESSVHFTQGSLIIGYWLDPSATRPVGWMSRGFDSLRVLYWLPHRGHDPQHWRLPLWLPAVAFAFGSVPAVFWLRRKLVEYERLRAVGLAAGLTFSTVAAASWVLSGWYNPAWTNTLQTRQVALERGRILFATGTLLAGPAVPMTQSGQQIPGSGRLIPRTGPAAAQPAPTPSAAPKPPWFSLPGVSGRGYTLDVKMPLWLFLAPAVAASLFFFAPGHRIRKRRRLGQCIKCAYDLRGSAGRCPECGHADATRASPG